MGSLFLLHPCPLTRLNRPPEGRCPPAEVCAPPLGRDSLIAATAEGQYLVGALPRILCFFEPFSALRGGFGLGSGQRSFWHSRQPCAFIADLADRDSYLLDYRTSSWDAN